MWHYPRKAFSPAEKAESLRSEDAFKLTQLRDRESASSNGDSTYEDWKRKTSLFENAEIDLD